MQPQHPHTHRIPDNPGSVLLPEDTKLGEDAIFTVPCLFPICAAILTFIAMRYIARDEAMVIASTRLRSGKRGHRSQGK